MEPYTLLKQSALSFASIKNVAKALHSGARADSASARINRANSMLDAYKGSKGMGWRVDLAQKSLDKYTPLQQDFSKQYDSYADQLGKGQRRALDFGRSVASTVYDMPKMLAMHPASRTGMVGSLLAYTGADLIGFNADPYSRIGQLHGLSNTKDIATNYGTQGGHQAVNDLVDEFDSLGIRDRMQFAKNPNLISGSITPTNYDTNKRFNLSSLIAGRPDMLDNQITSGIANKVNNFKL